MSIAIAVKISMTIDVWIIIDEYPVLLSLFPVIIYLLAILYFLRSREQDGHTHRMRIAMAHGSHGVKKNWWYPVLNDAASPFCPWFRACLQACTFRTGLFWVYFLFFRMPKAPNNNNCQNHKIPGIAWTPKKRLEITLVLLKTYRK